MCFNEKKNFIVVPFCETKQPIGTHLIKITRLVLMFLKTTV